MALITFLSDFGHSDHYVSAVKAKILSINPKANIVDISHEIDHFDLTHAAFVLKSVYKEFPKGTIHLIAVDSASESEPELYIFNLEDHYFVINNNGLIGLINEKSPESAVKVANEVLQHHTFPTKEIAAEIVAKLAGGESPDTFGTENQEYKRMLPLQLKATKKQVSGNVVRVDHYGNLITNIEEKVFNILHKERGYKITFGRETARRMLTKYADTDAGDCYIIFNDLGLMEIGINKGNASQLLGLSYGSPVSIFFDEQD